MIFITVGSATYKFDRLFKTIDELCEEKIIDKNSVYAQTGITEYKSKNYTCVEMIKNTDFYKKIEESDIIICHAGVGTIINSLTLGKKVIVFPRQKEFNEHVDNHQIEIASLFADNGYVMCATNKKELIKCIKNMDDFSPNEFVSSNGSIDDYIIKYLEGDQNE